MTSREELQEASSASITASSIANVKLYLDYLDKEMNIMGLLSAFCVAALSLTLNQMFSAKEGEQLYCLWKDAHWYILGGSMFLLFAALSFYRQRSLLAWYYGQITLVIAIPQSFTYSLSNWLRDADSWGTWVFYRWGFGFLIVGLIAYTLALLSLVHTGLLSQRAIFVAGLVILVILAGLWRCTCILRQNPYADDPLTLRSFFGSTSADKTAT
jgi:hypothetical protein